MNLNSNSPKPKHRFNFALALLAWGSISLGQYLYHLKNPQLGPTIELEKYLVLFVILLLFSYAKNKTLRFLSLSFILIFSFFQWSHISYYGTRTFPHEIWLFFTQMGEITGTLKEELYHVILPLALTLPPVIGIYWLNRRWSQALKSLPLVSFLFIFYFAYNPARTYITGNTWGRQPSVQEFDGVSAYLSLSYFLGRILPAKVSASEGNEKLQLTRKAVAPKDANIIFVLGESLTPNHMSLFGYERQTTPYLESLKDDPNFTYKKAISSGVSTDISVALFFNNTYGLGGTGHIFTGEHCLFKLARSQGFETRFLSTQSTQQLRYINASICPKYIQTLKSLEQINPENTDPNAADDMHLVRELKKLNLSEKKGQFTVLHMRGTHGPFNLRYPAEFGKFVPKDAATTERVGHYDNGVAYFDHFMQELIAEVKTYKNPTLVVYVSDHGEGLGEEGVWGHGSLNTISSTIPLLVYQHNMQDERAQLPKLPTHFNVSLLMSEFLGHQFNRSSSEQFRKFEVLGNDIDGFAGQMVLDINENGEITKQTVVQ